MISSLFSNIPDRSRKKEQLLSSRGSPPPPPSRQRSRSPRWTRSRSRSRSPPNATPTTKSAISDTSSKEREIGEKLEKQKSEKKSEKSDDKKEQKIEEKKQRLIEINDKTADKNANNETAKKEDGNSFWYWLPFQK